MISFRAHIVSIAAVFLALAVGLLLGSGGVSSRLLDAVTNRNASLQDQLTAVTAERDALAAAARSADEFAERVGPAAIRGILQGQRVLLVTAAGADAGDITALTELVGQAGATITGTVALTEAVGDPARGDQLRELASRLLPPGAQLPAAADTGSIVGGLIGGTLLGPGADTNGASSVLSGLAAAGFVSPGDVPAPADLVLVVTGGALTGVDAGDAAAVVARFAAQMDRLGRGTVLVGRTGTADATGVVGVARADPNITRGVSTVDDVQTGTGRVSTVLALREQLDERAGRYGMAATATDGAAPKA
ncbi:Copper transport outer membrane protein, MctB [Pseudonocardia thermophila]|uniref:Copper transport outer membrane protein, MctB n=1 Tax=Pseudonocardia thermophila TaxID=1848 RepID=A0A1M6SWX4_PSETH|nr:copper transporter [Pseudonocardia thermophila]SHK49232.1 Copper transport outer membrane protein, MctB [Pseudonocardia thermophila]